MGSISGLPGAIDSTALRQGVFKVIWQLISDNIPNGGWTMKSDGSIVPPKFPEIVINPVNINSENLTMSGTGRQRPVKCIIEMYVVDKVDNGWTIKFIDMAKDKITTTFEDNQTALLSEGLILDNIDDVNSEVQYFNREKVHSGALQLNMKYCG